MADKTIGTAYVQIIPSADGMKNNLTRLFNGEAGDAGKKLGDKLGAGLKTGLKTTAAVAGAAIAAAGAAIVSIGKQAISSYADFEQLEGGIATLFGNSSNEVMQNAANAFKTAGMSANEYMETVTSFSASLIKGMGGDTEAAAKLADVAITDMADNANKMGSDMESIQNAYNGFAKQNYTMLDNLKLGYGGTKEEMQRLIDDANALNAAQGNMTSYSIDSYADIVSAIHDVQTEMGITGTTAAEAGSTIQGSVSSAKAAWQNWLTALGDSNADVQAKTDDLMNAVGTAMQNILPVAKQVLSSIGEALKTRLPQFLSEAVSFVLESLPEILSLGIELLKALGEGLYQGFAKLLPMVGEWIQENLISPAKEKIGDFLDAGKQIVDNIIQGIKDKWEGLRSWFHNIWDGLFGNLNVNTTVSASANTPNGNNSYAKGLDYVPYDEFPAILHKGEAVLTASEAASWRAGGTGNGKVINIYQTIQSVQQTPVQLAAATAAYFEQARWAI